MFIVSNKLVRYSPVDLRLVTACSIAANCCMYLSLVDSNLVFKSDNNSFSDVNSVFNFEILSDFNSMYEGLIIKYRVSPFPFTRVGWTTKITYVEKPFGFIDKQISGPFSFWEHEHKFEEKNKSLWAYDVVKFKLPLGFIGRFFGGKIVKYQLKNIFEFRRKQLDKFFKK